MEAIRQRRYEDVIPLVQNDLLAQQTDSEEFDFTRAFRDYILLARFALMKEDVMVSAVSTFLLFGVVSFVSPLIQVEFQSLKEHLGSFDTLWNKMGEEEKNERINKRYRSMYHILLASWKILEHCDTPEEFVLPFGCILSVVLMFKVLNVKYVKVTGLSVTLQ